MKNKIYIEVDDYPILANLFQNLPCDVFVFGSRIKGTQRKFSDLDLCLKAKKPIDLATIAMLKEALSQSDLPFTVDVIDYNSLSAGFKKIIDEEGVLFNETKPAAQFDHEEFQCDLD